MNTVTSALSEARAYLMLAGVCLLGLAGGIWTVLAPFATSWPLHSDGSWTHAVWAAVIPGLVLTAASGAAIVLCAGLAVRAAVQAKTQGSEDLA